MSFEAKRHLIKVQGGRTYLPVSARLIWFRGDHPDWCIETESVALDLERQYAIFRAKISNAEGRLMAVATKCEDVSGFPDYIEKAETGAVGRALALCGYGTQFAAELDESGIRHRGPADDIDSGHAARSSERRGDPVRTAERRGDAAPRMTAGEPAPLTLVTPNDAADSPPHCIQCAKAITRSQQELSLHRFGDPLCPACQKERSRTARPEPAAASLTAATG